MSKNKHVVKMFLLLFAVFFAALFLNDSVFAVSVERGIVEDGNHIRWEYSLQTDGEGKSLSVMFYDKPAGLTTVTVPSLADFLSLVPNAPANLDTYYLRDADTNAQDEAYPDYTRREATADTTKLDMANTSKIQVMGVKPIIDKNVETELVFGPNMVIGDVPAWTLSATLCDMERADWGEGPFYYCQTWDSTKVHEDELFLSSADIPGWDDKTASEKAAFVPTMETLGCLGITDDDRVPASEYATHACYYISTNDVRVVSIRSGGAFRGYKLKLTNFNEDNFNYIGWDSFRDSTLDVAHTTMTITGDAFLGGDIFRNSNVKNVSIQTTTYGTGLFRDCRGLESVSFGNNVTMINPDTFAGSGLTTISFANTNITRIGARAFDGASLTNIDLTNIQRINYSAFEGNDIKELYLPKSINYLESNLFYGNKNLKKVTVAYDTLTSGTTLPFYIVLDGKVRGLSDDNAAENHIEELIVLAPYADGEAVSATHVSYDDYRWHYDAKTQEHRPNERIDRSSGNNYGAISDTAYGSSGNFKFEDDYADVDSKKNVVAPIYFTDMHALKKLTVGDGYEYIGSSAFWTAAQNTWGNMWVYHISDPDYRPSDPRPLEEINLPEGLKGVGNLAFEEIWSENLKLKLPKSLEFIGMGAFRKLWNYKFDFDLPNLKYLGDYAFESTMAQNIILHDKMFYYGEHVFSNCMSIKDITIDYDIFNPELRTVWAGSYLSTAAGSVNHENNFREQFGEWYSSMYSISDEAIARWGAEVGYYPFNWSGKFQKFGKITFTDKVIHEVPMLEKVTVQEWWGGTTTSDRRFDEVTDLFFGHLIADEVDLSKTGWKILPPNAFNNSRIGKIKLPEHLEALGAGTFSQLVTDQELVLPDTLKYIGASAFEGYYTWSNDDYAPPVIKSLPSSLEYIGDEAFWGDYNLAADLNAPNLKYIGIRAFWGTNVRDVLIPNGVKRLREGTFANAPSLRDITIDADFGAIVAPTAVDQFETPQLIKNYINDPEAERYYLLGRKWAAKYDDSFVCESEDDWTYGSKCVIGKDYETFYTIFNGINKRDSSDTTNYQSTVGGDFGTLTFTDKNVTELGGMIGNFSYLSFDRVDMGAAKWKKTTIPQSAFKKANIGVLVLPRGLETVTSTTFEEATIDEPFALPTTLKELGYGAFQWAKGTITNMLPNGVETVGTAAFYSADMTDNLVVPDSVSKIGWSAFNAGSADVFYDTVLLKPSLTKENSSDQLVHTLFWKAKMDKLTVESSTLAGYERGNGDAPGNQEFYNMKFKEVVITKLPKITFGAFDECGNLEKVDLSADSALRTIAGEAFKKAKKLHIIKFSPAIKNETVTIGKYAFMGTAFTTIGDSTKEFDLRAAKFSGVDGFAFADMPKLSTVDVPGTFSSGTIPEATFYNDPELTQATVDYKITLIGNAAFANDNKLERIFIWGDTVVLDENLPDYVPPIRGGMGADGDELEGAGPTIPEGTDIYAYSVAATKEYAAFGGRENFEGTFYPLDEVLYITSNKKNVRLNDAEDDFDKTGLKIYAMRRDGVILQSDNWGVFSGKAFPRSSSTLNFAKMEATIAENPVFGTIWDTPVPISELDFGNENFAQIGFEMQRNADNKVELINVIYTDKYTLGKSDTDLEPDRSILPPITHDTVWFYVAALLGSVIALTRAAVVFARRSRRSRA